jgi:hypothetical protein
VLAAIVIRVIALIMEAVSFCETTRRKIPAVIFIAAAVRTSNITWLL